MLTKGSRTTTTLIRYASSAAAVLFLLFLAFRIWGFSSDYDIPDALDFQPATSGRRGPKYGCRHFYFNIGVRDGRTIVDFINRATNSSDRATRAVVGYSIQHDLALHDFCIFGFEPNFEYSPALFKIVRDYKPLVRYLHIFTASLAGTIDAITATDFNKTTGALLSWGRKRRWAAAPGVFSSQTMSLDFGKFLYDALGDDGPRGQALMRIDSEGAEFVVLRDNLAIICQHVSKLEVEFHTERFTSEGTCAQWMMHFLLSAPKCKPRWERPTTGVPQVCDLWEISENFRI